MVLPSVYPGYPLSDITSGLTLSSSWLPSAWPSFWSYPQFLLATLCMTQLLVFPSDLLGYSLSDPTSCLTFNFSWLPVVWPNSGLTLSPSWLLSLSPVYPMPDLTSFLTLSSSWLPCPNLFSCSQFLLATLCLTTVMAAKLDNLRLARLLRDDSVAPLGANYRTAFEIDNGIKVEETGSPGSVGQTVVRGSYSWVRNYFSVLICWNLLNKFIKTNISNF